MRIGEAAGGGEGEVRVRMGRERRGKEGGRRWREKERIITVMSSAS